MEHTLHIISIAHYSQTCLKTKEPIKEFFESQLSQLFTFFPFSPWLAFFGKLVNIISTFAWSFMDLFLMMVSVGLSSRFKQINDDLERIKGEVETTTILLSISNCFKLNQFNSQHMTEDYWALRRTQYRKLSGLCIIVDDAISQITFLSFSNNLFFISVQLLRSIRYCSFAIFINTM